MDFFGSALTAQKKSRNRNSGLSFLFHIELFLELFYTAAAVDKLLLTCEERMACRAYI